MSSSKTPLVSEDDIYVLTERGQAELRHAYTTLLPLALELLVRMDGAKSLASLRFIMPDVPYERLAETVALLLHEELIAYGDRREDVFHFNVVSHSAAINARSSNAADDREATESLNSLNRQGFFVRIARRPNAKPELPQDRAPILLVVEDEPLLAQFLTHYMRLEGFDVRTAADKAAIIQGLRDEPAPDLVLLDVMLPDVNGFDVLTSIREHPKLNALPVLMLTSSATREAVITGLWRGADGYVTKPFQPHVLIKAVRTIFGLKHEPERGPWEEA